MAGKRVLVVDDEKLIVKGIRFSLEQDNMEVDCAYDGEEALEMAHNKEYDIILLDVMLPKLTGFEVCQQIREFSNVPVIMLTAKGDDMDKILGLEYGADDYITKPFSATYLQARVENLLSQRKKLQSFYRENLLNIPVADSNGSLSGVSTTSETVVGGTSEAQKNDVDGQVSEVPGMSPNDRKFMDKLVELMEKNMDNGELVVDDLVSELAVSRSVFFKKLKTLTGLAPIEFIKEMRMKRAVQLIETGEFNMTQISYMVGINDPRYFSKCFKAQVGMTPTEYRDKKQGK